MMLIIIGSTNVNNMHIFLEMGDMVEIITANVYKMTHVLCETKLFIC